MSRINNTLNDIQLAEVERGLSKLSPRYDRKAAVEAIYHLYEVLRLPKPKVFYLKSPTQISNESDVYVRTFGKHPPRPRGLKPWKRALRKVIRNSPAGINLQHKIREGRIWLEDSLGTSASLQNPFLSRPLFLAVAACSTNLELKLSKQTINKIQAWAEVYATAHIFVPKSDAAYISAPPKMLLDGNGRLHCENGMAIRYSDKTGLYFWHGVLVPEYVVLQPKKITVTRINGQTNAEVRRIMMERYGLERFLRNAGASRINTGRLGVLYDIRFGNRHRRLWWGRDPEEWARFVVVKNSTPEPDGSFKKYVLQVPPDMRRADQAVAWTFGFHSEREYKDALKMET